METKIKCPRCRKLTKVELPEKINVVFCKKCANMLVVILPGPAERKLPVKHIFIYKTEYSHTEHREGLKR